MLFGYGRGGCEWLRHANVDICQSVDNGRTFVSCPARRTGHVPVDEHVHTHLHSDRQVGYARIMHNKLLIIKIYPHRAPSARAHHRPSGDRVDHVRLVYGVRCVLASGW